MKRDSLRQVLGCAVLACLATVPSTGSAAEAPWDQKFTNPKPLPDDVVLPMPCGGGMVFRPVEIPSEGPLGDYQVTLGGTDEEQGYSEASRPIHLAGSFNSGKSQRQYLMAKYEVSQLQYDAVTKDECPKPTLGRRLPQVEVSWIDATAFADRYSVWLLRNAADQLPKDGTEPGFVRLPTEGEWEFAARGGIKVSPAEFSERVPPMPEGMARHVWFAGSQSANGKLQLTGLLQPNPLGLHDMLGNADEIVFEPFRLNKLGRLHGQAGGFVVRGGNYFTAEPDIRSAYRQEMPYYDKDAPRRSKTTGFRVLVAGPVLTSQAKLKAVRDAWSALGATNPAETKPQATVALGDKPADDPMEELALIAKAAPDAKMKTRLQNLQIALRANVAARDEQRDRAARTTLRLGAFLGRKLADDSKAVQTLSKMYESRAGAGANDSRAKAYKEQLDQEQGVLDENLRYYADTLIRTAEDFGEQTLRQQAEILVVELKGIGLQDLVPYAQKHIEHVLDYQKSKRVLRSQWLSNWNKM